MNVHADQIVYLDNNATTRVHPRVLEAMLPFYAEFYGNPSSAYRFGSQVKKALETAAAQVAALIGVQPEEIVFTSCGTESDNTAIWSALQLDRRKNHVVTTTAEHSAILKQCAHLKKKGFRSNLVKVDASGAVDLDGLRKAIRPETAVVSVMWANNETGVISDIESVAEIAREAGVLFHSDAVQAAGKIPLNLGNLPIHYASFSGHKLHAPKGIGVLYANRNTRFQPYLIGGSQQGEKRAGTEDVAYIVAMGMAAELARNALEDSAGDDLRQLRDRFEKGILEQVPEVEVNGDPARRVPNTSNLYFPGLDGESILTLLEKQNICCSSGSACNTGSVSASHVLKAMGFADSRARSSLRFSVSRMNTPEEIDKAVAALAAAVAKLREIGPGSGPVKFAD